MYEYLNTGSTWDGSAAVYSRLFRDLGSRPLGTRILDAGCGNGYLISQLVDRGLECFGVDPSETGITLARGSCPAANFACFDLTVDTGALILESFDIVTCIEVIEHVYAPRLLLSNLFRLLKPGGKLILTTPYHGYFKNLAIVTSGRFDRHLNPLWDHGHIKFFSHRTLKSALSEAGFGQIEISGIGRMPGLWKTMMASAIRPGL
jgi:2-polyprenyl-3-methyl-5-hydroxy-6-metoxy-1,4-benzoquinol methylase